jgi:hypothetical protein
MCHLHGNASKSVQHHHFSSLHYLCKAYICTLTAQCGTAHVAGCITPPDASGRVPPADDESAVLCAELLYGLLSSGRLVPHVNEHVTGHVDQGFFFSCAFCSVLALGVDLGTRFGSGFWLRPAANMTCLALASDNM